METESSSTQALPAGTRLEEFVIERVLGSGGFGITYLARDTRLDRQVVIKENLPAQFCFRDTHSLTVAPRHTHGDDADNFRWSLENFSKEAAMLASLDHPGIVKVLRSFEAFGTAYFVMPFVEGRTLDELILHRAGKPLAEAELRGILERVLAALGYLHDRGIYHRDIKPGNILITTEGLPVLIDFGSARQRLSERSMTVVESAGYTPFEQLQSKGSVGPWSDLYALGATFAKIITGEAPPKANDRAFGDPWQPMVSRMELEGRYSNAFLAALDRALKLPIEERWQSTEEWKAPLEGGEAAAKGGAAVPGEESVAAGAKHFRSPAWRWVALWLLLSAGLLIAAGYGYWHFGKGTVRIASDPAGAEVLRHGVVLGQTPMSLTSLDPFSEWTIGLRMEGYQPDTLAARVGWRERSTAPVRALKPRPQKVIVTSEPAGAEVVVVVDGKVVGLTPWEGPEREVGERVELLLRKDGWIAQTLRGEVGKGHPLELSVALTQDAFYAERLDETAVAALAEKGDAYAQALLGIRMFFGPHVGLDDAERVQRKAQGLELLEKSATNKHPLGLAARGSAEARSGGKEGLEFAQARCLEAVEAGLLEDLNARGAQWIFYAGVAYDTGCGVAKDAAEAVKWYRKAAEQGLALAQDFLGRSYFHGEGVAKDAVEAVKWFRKAAEQDDAEAQCYLGFCYEYGEGVAEDAAEAVKWYRKAAEQGLALAQDFLGRSYFYGEGVAKDPAEAVKWYRKAAEQEESSAQYSLGLSYANGEGVAKDPVRALMWFMIAAESGNETAGENQKRISAELSSSAIAKARRLAAEWKVARMEPVDEP